MKYFRVIWEIVVMTTE